MGYTSYLEIYLPRPEPDRTRTGPELNFYITRMGADFDKPEKPKPEWIKPKLDWDPECPCLPRMKRSREENPTLNTYECLDICIAHSKIESTNLRKLNNRSRTLVHLGTEPGSKAYRLLDPTQERIVMSRDVVFGENKLLEWNRNGHHEAEKT